MSCTSKSLKAWPDLENAIERAEPAKTNTQLVKAMKLIRITALSAFLAGTYFAAGVPDAAAAKIKCWTNNEGVRECGNVVPPEFAQKGHEEMNKQGLTVTTQERAKTPEELEKERLEQEERERQAALEAEQARKDRVLLATFASEEDLKLAHQGKVAALDTQIKHTEANIAKLEGSLKKLVQDAASQERGGKKVSDQTKKEIKEVKRQIEEHRTFIEEREQEKIELSKSFEAELARFRRLKAQN